MELTSVYVVVGYNSKKDDSVVIGAYANRKAAEFAISCEPLKDALGLVEWRILALIVSDFIPNKS